MTLDEMILEFKESADGQEQRLKGLREKDINTYVRMKATAKKLRLVEGWLKELKYLRKQMQQAIDAIEKLAAQTYDTDYGVIDSDVVYEALKELPSDLSTYSDKLWKNAYERGKAEGQADRKKGHWIPHDTNAAWTYANECSECGKYLVVSDISGDGKKANFCPNCGADMRGDEHG